MNHAHLPHSRGRMGATAFELVREDIHVSEPGIVDPHGTPIRRGFMARLDEKSAEIYPLRKGTVWAIGIVPAFAMLVITLGGALIMWARQDQSTIERQIQMQNDIQRIAAAVEKQTAKYDELDRRLQSQEIQSSKADGYKLGVIDAHNAKGK